MQKSLGTIRGEMIDVADKFYHQLEKLLNEYGFAEKNTFLQERLSKAADYFLKKLAENIEIPLAQSGFETDNKAIHKRISDLTAQTENEIFVRRAGMESAKKGFSIKNYLEARALASIEKYPAKAKKETENIDTKNPELYRKLIQWRREKSMETGLELSKIISLKAAIEIAGKIPSTVAGLKAIKGFGGKKMELFGQDILALTIGFRHEKGMDIPPNAKEEIEIAGLNTREISLMYFRQGLSPEEIAKKRNFAVSTIESHLSYFVGKGELNIFELISKSKFDVISHYLRKKKEDESFSEIKNRLGNNYSYGEIKLVMAHMDKQTEA